ncbi:MAG: hypothetical protein HDR03_10535 [Lachnospiraceae bacterium]|nr:hypothetical protein [Lachnospiraceae bacterium]
MIKEKSEDVTRDLEKMITIRIIQEDAETIFSLLKTERDPIFAMEIIPYYALFVQACQEYMGDTFVEGAFWEKIKDIRNFIKVYGNSFGKVKKRIDSVDIQQDEQYKSQLRFDFMKDWDVHFNLGTYWTADKHIIGNTQMFADFLEINDLFDCKTGMAQYEMGRQIGAFVASVREGISSNIKPPLINRCHVGVNIEYYYDLNTHRRNLLFVENSSKIVNLFFLNIVCNMNFVKYILRPLFDENNIWIFRVEYIVTYYTYMAIQRLKNYCENNADVHTDLSGFTDVFSFAEGIFMSKFRNCMMHYGLEDQGVISMENIEKPFYGIVENCYGGMDFNSFRRKLRSLSDKMVALLEDKLNVQNVQLQHL